MITEPKLENRTDQHYMAIRTQVTMEQLNTVIPQGIGEVFAWLGQRGVVSPCAPFIRYHVIDMGAKFDVEIGVPVVNTLSGDDRVHAGVLPAGRYASLVYTGIDNGMKGNAALIDWGAKQGLVWDTWKDANGDGFGGRFESFITDPAIQPDRAEWDTEVGIRLADNQAR